MRVAQVLLQLWVNLDVYNNFAVVYLTFDFFLIFVMLKFTTKVKKMRILSFEMADSGKKLEFYCLNFTLMRISSVTEVSLIRFSD